jgi:phosphatidylserine/phosphatidylglycerophosphate/cardiolipin synthase-like enzyme
MATAQAKICTGDGSSAMLTTSVRFCGTPVRGLDAIRFRRPHGQRLPGTSLHGKVIVVDDHVALVSSANLTSRVHGD